MSASLHDFDAMRQPAVPALPAHYQLRGQLGEGGQGMVYEAWDSKLCRSVAVKCIKPGQGAQGADLVREARLAASLRHTAFVQVHAVEDDGGRQFIVMEMVSGRTFKSAFADGPLGCATALDWIGQIAEGMREAHASGLVHGDLKPSNLMVEARGAVRILDVGIARRTDELATATGQPEAPQGTIAYMAPERLLGARADEQSDIYALGVVLYEAVTGERPFPELGGLALAAAQVQSSSECWRYPATLDAPLISLIRDLTARRPAQRLRTMDEVLTRLGQLSQVAHPRYPAHIGTTLRPVRPAGPARWMLLTWGAAAVCTVGAGAWVARNGGLSAPSALSASQAPAYSETHELRQGLEAIRLFDRPGKLERANKHFERVLAHHPDNAAAVAGVSLANSLRYASDRQDDIWLLKGDAGAQQALKLNDQLALSHIAQGWVFDSRAQHAPALAAFERALALDPGDWLAWYGKVQTLRHARRFDEALAVLNLAMQRFPRERVFTDELGSVHFERADYAKAGHAFRRSIALQPDAVVAYANLNATLLRQNRPDDALRVLQEGLQIRPGGILYGNLGNALFLRGDYLGAAAAFENAVSPTRGSPGNYLNWANLADTLRWIPGREQGARAAYDTARRLLEPRLLRAPDNVVLISRMGLYAARLNDADRARTLMTRALALAPDSPDVQFRAALAYELLGAREPALAAIASAHRLGYPVQFIDAEPDLAGLRRDFRYALR